MIMLGHQIVLFLIKNIYMVVATSKRKEKLKLKRKINSLDSSMQLMHAGYFVGYLSGG